MSSYPFTVVEAARMLLTARAEQELSGWDYDRLADALSAETGKETEWRTEYERPTADDTCGWDEKSSGRVRP